jgi:hypothetical protein
LPPGISQLTSLNHLWLSSNNLRSLREEVASLFSLTDLRIASNSFREWPHALGQLTRLVHLDVSRCTFRQLPAAAVHGTVGLQRLSSLKHLDLSLCALVAPPPAGFLPPSLTTLYLSANPFEVSPLLTIHSARLFELLLLIYTAGPSTRAAAATASRARLQVLRGVPLRCSVAASARDAGVLCTAVLCMARCGGAGPCDCCSCASDGW